jgi:hypothetical protein
MILKTKPLSRRDFLKLSGSAFLSIAFLPEIQTLNKLINSSRTRDPEQPLGRISANSINLYDSPSSKGGYLRTIKFNTVLPITKVVIGDPEPAYNQIWYELDGKGYGHSGNIQPVQNRINPVEKKIPSGGLLAEVTVPYTNGALHPNWPNSIVYRLYYGCTFWVNNISEDRNGQFWYRIIDEEGYIFYADATHLHIIKPQDITLISPEVPSDAKRIEVDLENQFVVAYEHGEPVFMTRTATGAQFYTGDFSTPKGEFITNRKRPSRHMMDPAGSSYDLPGVPWVSYITSNGVAFHGTYWHNDYGNPRSHGCINLTNEAARWIYRWSLPKVPIKENYISKKEGTTVVVY